jgi:Tfp pilus assembly protein PilO
MDILCLTISLISLTIIVVVSVIIFTQYAKFKNHLHGDLDSIVQQVNDVNDLTVSYNQLQENNIKNLDNNMQILREKVGTMSTTIPYKDATLLVKKNLDNTVSVCTPDGNNCRAL